jgi:hypothetical protein
VTAESLPFSDRGGSVVLDLITEQFELDQARKQSFEQRGLALVTTSGGFVTILFGLITIASRTGAGFVVPHSARVLVIAALALLFGAALCGIGAAFPLRFIVPEIPYLRGLLADEIWTGSGIKTSQRIAEGKLKMLKRSRKRTRFKGWALILGLLAEVAAVALLGAAVWVVL